VTEEYCWVTTQAAVRPCCSRVICGLFEFGFQLGSFYVFIFDNMCINSDTFQVFRNVIIDKLDSVCKFNFTPVTARLY
jgi:hypothetical protein